MNKNNIISLIRNSNNVKSKMLEQTKDYWLMKVYGEFKDMTKTEVGFSNKQLEQLEVLITRVVERVVPPMVEKIVDQKLDPIKKDILEIKKDIEAIKNCPTIKKELNQSNK